jgi:hypothetical protein
MHLHTTKFIIFTMHLEKTEQLKIWNMGSIYKQNIQNFEKDPFEFID